MRTAAGKGVQGAVPGDKARPERPRTIGFHLRDSLRRQSIGTESGGVAARGWGWWGGGGLRVGDLRVRDYADCAWVS